MKKEYFAPSTVSVSSLPQDGLLAASGPEISGKPADGSEVLSKENDLWEEEDS